MKNTTPNNMQLEIYLIWIIYMDTGFVEENNITDLLFYDRAIKKLFNEIQSLRKKWLNAEVELLALNLSLDKTIIEDMVFSMYSWDRQNLLNELKELAVARFIYSTCERATDMVFTKWSEDVKDYIIKNLDKITGIEKDMDISDFALEYLDNLGKVWNTYWSWFHKIDEILKLKQQQLVVVAGRPWMWKTTVMQNIALRQSSDNKVAFISLEMSGAELIERFVCMTTECTIGDLEKKWSEGIVSDKLWEILQKKLHIKDKLFSLQEIEWYIRQCKIKDGLDVVFIDYLGLIKGTKKSIIENISEITAELKRIAKRYEIVIVLWCQLNRDVEKRVDKQPVLSDLRDSWTIEQDADIVIMLYREEYYDEDTENKWILDVLIRKQRNGKIWRIPMSADFSCFRIN